MSRPLKEMPFFSPEREVAREVLGPGHVAEWRALATILERRGMPQIDPMFGARYWPAVRAWLDYRHGVGPRMKVPAIAGLDDEA
jgi:hypothetical protein